jgi:hypothetical protein
MAIIGFFLKLQAVPLRNVISQIGCRASVGSPGCGHAFGSPAVRKHKLCLRSVRLWGDWLIQRCPQRVRQCGWSEWLLQKGYAFIQQALMNDGIFGVGGGKKNSGVRM